MKKKLEVYYFFAAALALFVSERSVISVFDFLMRMDVISICGKLLFMKSKPL